MRVLVTGAGGNLGRVVLPALREAGHEPVAYDMRPLELEYESHVGDVSDAERLRAALPGVEAIVHGAALHGVHLRRYAPADFWRTNATGTFTVYDAARAAGVDRIVLASTMGVYGQSLRRSADAFAWTSEDDPTLPLDVYGLTKVVAEETARQHGRVHGITSVALRLGMYVPESFVRYGFRLLFGGVDDRDVAQAVLAALGHDPQGRFAAFNIMASVPFTRADAVQMAQDPAALIERHWPGAGATLRERGIDDVRPYIWGETIWPVDRARRELGYRPQYDFGRFLEALARDDESLYPFAGLPQWGL